MNHPGRTMTIYDIPEIVSEAWKDPMTIRNISSGFEKTGVWPYNDNVFTLHHHAVVTDHYLPVSQETLPMTHLITPCWAQTAQQVNVQFQCLQTVAKYLEVHPEHVTKTERVVKLNLLV